MNGRFPRGFSALKRTLWASRWLYGQSLTQIESRTAHFGFAKCAVKPLATRPSTGTLCRANGGTRDTLTTGYLAYHPRVSTFTTRQIADETGGELVGPHDLAIGGVNQLDLAEPGQVSFIRDGKYADAWATSRATAAVVGPTVDLEPGDGRAFIRVADADVAIAAVLSLFAPPPPTVTESPDDISPHAVVDLTAKLGTGVKLGPGCVVGPHVRLGDGCVIHANATVLDHSVLGSECVLWPSAVVRERCTLGDRCELHPGAVIGADGFNYRPDPATGRLVKIPHIGTVEMGSDVEVGANSTIDRGKFGPTRIGDGCKIDNLCQVAHNCQLGKQVVIAAGVMIAGSATIGDGVLMGGCASIRDHVTIGAGAQIMGCAAVMKDVPNGETWAGYPAQEAREAGRIFAATRKLPDLARKLRKL